jgi:hypothetical protein
MSVSTSSLSPSVPSLPSDLTLWDFYVRNLYVFFIFSMACNVWRSFELKTFYSSTNQICFLAAKWLSIPNLVPIRQRLNVTKLRPRGEDNTAGLLYILRQ